MDRNDQATQAVPDNLVVFFDPVPVPVPPRRQSEPYIWFDRL